MKRDHHRSLLSHAQRNGRLRITGGIVLVLGILTSVALLVIFLMNERPNLYDPTRVALVEAQRTLGEAYTHVTQEKALLEQMLAAHRALREALALLNQAERLDPLDRATIETLRSRLALLEDDRRTLRMSEDELRRTYQEMSAQMQALIEKRE